MKFVAVALLAFLFAAPVLALECTDLSNENGLGPARNQAGVGWCYAFTAAELVSNKLGFPVSASDIAMGYNYLSEPTLGYLPRFQRMLQSSNMPMQAGDTFDAIQLNQKFRVGFCSDSVIPSSQFEVFDPDNNLAAILGSVAKMKKRKELNENSCNIDTTKVNALFPRMNEIEIYSFLRVGKLETKTWYSLSEAACTDRAPLSSHAVKVSAASYDERTRLLDVVDDKLNQGSVVGLQYNPLSFVNLPWWQKPDQVFANVMGLLYRTVGLAEVPTHAVTIVGRRFNRQTQTCQYLIRDSDNFNCVRGRQGTCDSDGRIWYERKQIIKHVHDIIYLED